jgi:hypothetical protein
LKEDPRGPDAKQQVCQQPLACPVVEILNAPPVWRIVHLKSGHRRWFRKKKVKEPDQSRCGRVFVLTG